MRQQGVKLAAMQDAISTIPPRQQTWLSSLASRVRIEAPSISDWTAASLSSVLLILAFPDFGFWTLAWVGLVPLMVVIGRRPSLSRAFVLGWFAGSAFFYGSCYWLTYSMIHFGGIPGSLAYLLLTPGALILGLFPAGFALILTVILRRWRNKALLLAPFVWTTMEWTRLQITGQLWNALGYSQVSHPILIQPARWGGVYAVGFLLVAANSAVAFVVLNRCMRAMAISAAVLVAIWLAIFAGYKSSWSSASAETPALFVVALQPNVPMDPSVSSSEMQQLTSMHISESEKALQRLSGEVPRLVIWPESPMNFAYGSDSQFQNVVAEFTTQNHTSLLFNSQEAAPGNGLYNSAILVNEDGRAIAQYDKIRLMPFGEYVPLPRWVPGASLITAIVGDFTPGTRYTLIPAGPLRAGVFICIESAYPSIARSFTEEGADVLINISNDGYLGPTAVMRQHLANAIFRAVENGRPLLRVTNSGITAYVSPSGEVRDATEGFQTRIRSWTINRSDARRTFYTSHGDIFAWLSAILTLFTIALTLREFRKESRG